jgi:hypothetical protein
MQQTPNSFIGRRVQVWSRSGSTEHRDDGILRAITNNWIAIENDKSEWLLGGSSDPDRASPFAATLLRVRL